MSGFNVNALLHNISLQYVNKSPPFKQIQLMKQFLITL